MIRTRKSKLLSVLFVLAMSLALVWSMTASAFAATGDGYYVVGAATKYDKPINVKVVVESKQYSETDSTAISDVVNVQLGKSGVSGQTFNVRDAMVAVGSGSSGIKAYDSKGKAIDSSSTYISYIEKNGKAYAPALPMPDYELDGWMYRVNDKISLTSVDGDPSSGGPLGTDISTTPIKDGDVIHFYWDYPYNETSSSYYSTTFLTADMSYANNNLNIQLKKSVDWFDNSFYWHITAFENYANTASGNYDVSIYDAAGTEVKTGTVSKAGNGTITDCGLQSGKTYYVKVKSASYKTVTGYDEDFESVVWNILDTTMAYEKIEL